MERQGLANWWAPASVRTAVSKKKDTRIYQREEKEEGNKKKILQNKPTDERLYWKVQNTEENLKKFWKATHGYELAELHIIVFEITYSFLKVICKLNAIYIKISVTFL